ncbi:MAG TPA: hypothetical protein VGR48_12870, partial [Terriglobales bacterium]|nr:hypothetical protein [Terriglobales bacterium]
MKLAVLLVFATIVLLILGFVFPVHQASTPGIGSGEALPGVGASAGTAEAAVRSLLGDVQAHDWSRAYSLLANTSGVDKEAFVHDVNGNYGSLRTFSSLEGSRTRVLNENGDQALVRADMHWSTALGPIYDVRELKVVRQGGTWKVVWPLEKQPNVPPQVVPVNYLRWDVIYRGAQDDWGTQNVDSPQVRIVSMNAVQHGNTLVIVGEVVNEDTVPAFVDINAILIGENGQNLDQENSFDKVQHTLLPKQVSPYRIDFPGYNLSQVKSVRMDAKAMLVPASADPVIAVMDQREQTNVLGRKVLSGDLLNESGRVVNIAQVLATYYDSNGKVIWVSDGYVDRALLPQTPEPFAVDMPDATVGKVQ